MMGEVKVSDQTGQSCPKCGSEEGWYRDGKVEPIDLWIARIGGPKAPIVMSSRGGHCLACNHEEEAVYTA